jgi:hypothetical protein
MVLQSKELWCDRVSVLVIPVSASKWPGSAPQACL